MGKPKDPRFRDKDTEQFCLGERVLKFQQISRSDKQEARRKVVIIYQAKSWSEITMYFPYGDKGSNLEKLGKDQHSIRLSGKWRLVFRWDEERNLSYDIWINPHDKRYGKK